MANMLLPPHERVKKSKGGSNEVNARGSAWKHTNLIHEEWQYLCFEYDDKLLLLHAWKLESLNREAVSMD